MSRRSNRRTFLKSTSLGGLGLVLLRDSRPAFGYQTNEKLGIACIGVGSEGSVFSECPWNTRFVLLPQKRFEGFEGPGRSLPRSPGHHAEWIRACKGGPKPFSRFDIGGPQTEMLLLGNVALLAGHAIEYDPAAGTIAGDAKATRWLHRDYRLGWSV